MSLLTENTKILKFLELVGRLKVKVKIDHNMLVTSFLMKLNGQIYYGNCSMRRERDGYCVISPSANQSQVTCIEWA